MLKNALQLGTCFIDRLFAHQALCSYRLSGNDGREVPRFGSLVAVFDRKLLLENSAQFWREDDVAFSRRVHLVALFAALVEL